MKRLFKIIFSLIFVVTFIAITVYVDLGIDLRHYDNVFDEMDQGLQKRPNGTMAENLGGEVSYKNDGFLQDDGFPSDLYIYSASNERGKNNALPAVITYVRVTVDKVSNKEPIFIYYNYQLTDKLEVQVAFDYFKKTQTLSQTVTILNHGTKSDFQQVLADKGMTQKDFQRQTREILGRTVIRAWVRAKNSKSHFAEDDWGDVKFTSMTIKED